MKKVIMPFDGENFSEGAFSFATNLNKTAPIVLTGIFLHQADYARFFLSNSYLTKNAMGKNIEEEVIQRNIQQFIRLCEAHNIEYKIHEDLVDIAVPELTKETRFADLLIIGSEIFSKNIPENDSTIFLKNTLQHTECPVLIVPEKFYFPSQNILTYDGSPSSVFAIKQFSYLFPELCDNKTILVYAGENSEDIPGQINIEEFTASHFTNMAITVLNTGHKMNFNDWVIKHESPVLVSGSFGRSGLSSLFTKSFVINVIDAHQTIVFIAHQ